MSELSPQAEASDMQLATTRTARDKTPPREALRTERLLFALFRPD